MIIYCEVCVQMNKLNIIWSCQAATIFTVRRYEEGHTSLKAVCDEHYTGRYKNLWRVSKDEFMTEMLKRAL